MIQEDFLFLNKCCLEDLYKLYLFSIQPAIPLLSLHGNEISVYVHQKKYVRTHCIDNNQKTEVVHQQENE